MKSVHPRSTVANRIPPRYFKQTEKQTFQNLSSGPLPAFLSTRGISPLLRHRAPTVLDQGGCRAVDNSWQQLLFMADTVPPTPPTRHPSRWCVTAAIDPFPAEKNVRPPHNPKRATPATRNRRPPWQGETEEHHAMTKEIITFQAAQRHGTTTRTGPRNSESR